MTPALELRGVSRSFGALPANRDVSLSVAPGELHALVGENGAGKSTAMRIAAGLCRPDAGEIRIHGEPLLPRTPARAIALGLGMVHQHFMLAESLSVVENVVLGREPRRHGLLDLRAAAARLAALGAETGLSVDPMRRITDLSVGERQRVEIQKVLWRNASVLVLDEPTAVLAPGEARGLCGALRRLCAAGRAVVLVSHRLDEVISASDRVTVLRRGEVVARLETARTTAAEIARAMLGGESGDPAMPAARPAAGPAGPALEVRDLVAGRLLGVSLGVRPGEILGIAGVEGNGQHDLVEAIAGLRPAERGAVRLLGRDATRLSVGERRAAGLSFVSEDRETALVADFTLAENLRLGAEAPAADLLLHFGVRPADPAAPAAALSGGNRQKLLLARELGRDFSVLVAAHPTRGIDLASARFVRARLLAARAEGKAVLLVSADLEELRALCDRIAVLYRGEIAGTLRPDEASDEALGALMTGAHAA
jgi:general nucleoside transport system ATP-binding protein